MHLTFGDQAQAWRTVRSYVRTLQGFSRDFRDFPSFTPSRQQLLDKYSTPASSGGWNAAEMPVEQMKHMDLDYSTMRVIENYSDIQSQTRKFCKDLK